MDADTILMIRPALTRYLSLFDDCFARSEARKHLATYVASQLGPLPRKSIEPMADAAGIPPRNLQQLLSLHKWDESAMRDLVQQRVARLHSSPHTVGILDETSFVKKGDKTACVQRQYCGTVGKKENCVVSVHLGYATPDFHTLLDGELYLPENTWHADRERCRAAKIPDDVVYRSKWQIGLGQVLRARGNGIFLEWLTFDEGYGGKPPFLRKLDEIGQKYVGEVPSDFRVWTRRPATLHREHSRDRHAPAKRRARLKRKNNPTVEVRNVAAYSPIFRREDWKTYHVKDGHKGPQVWKAKRLMVYLKDDKDQPTRPHHLLVAANVLEPDTIKYFISNGPENTPVETLLLVAFSRWKIERMFEDGKGELGMDHFEVRRFGSIQRHLILSCVSYLFLAEFHQEHREKKSAPDALPGSNGDRRPGPAVGPRGPLLPSVRRVDLMHPDPHATPKRHRRPLPPQANLTPTTQPRPTPQNPHPMPMATLVAL